MAYTFEHSYYFRPYRGNSSFWLNRYGNGSIASHQKATLYTAAGSADQRLKVHKVSGGCQLLSDLNNAYGLNIYGRGAGSVCDFFRVSGNERDALIDLLTVDATNNLYRIKMINHNLYLTPASNSSGAALTWENASNAAIPDMLTFLDMYKTSRVEDLDMYHKWLENRTYESMRSLIGQLS